MTDPADGAGSASPGLDAEPVLTWEGPVHSRLNNLHAWSLLAASLQKSHLVRIQRHASLKRGRPVCGRLGLVEDCGSAGLEDCGSVGLEDCGSVGLEVDCGLVGSQDLGWVGLGDCSSVGLEDCGSVGSEDFGSVDVDLAALQGQGFPQA